MKLKLISTFWVQTSCDLKSRYVQHSVVAEENEKQLHWRETPGCFSLEIKHSEGVTRGCFCKLPWKSVSKKEMHLLNIQIMFLKTLKPRRHDFQLDMAGVLLFFMTFHKDRWHTLGVFYMIIVETRGTHFYSWVSFLLLNCLFVLIVRHYRGMCH